MTTPQEQVAADIETTVRAIPGVTAIFRSGTTVSKVVDAGARLLGIREDDAPLVRVDQTPKCIRVEVAVGVHEAAGASDTARRVHAAIDDLLARRSTAPRNIRLTVVHIDDNAPHR